MWETVAVVINRTTTFRIQKSDSTLIDLLLSTILPTSLSPGMTQKQILDCYNKTAAAYAEELFDELKHKPFDRLLLSYFAKENKGKGKTLDLGCGPGQTTRFLHEQGLPDILGTDLSTAMVQKAIALSHSLHFEQADMLSLPYANNSFGSAIAFYAIVHFNEDELKKAFAEVRRVLKKGGQFLFSFHIGSETIHRTELFGQEVDIDFYFFETNALVDKAREAGFNTVDIIERYPYPEVEHQSKRAYILLD
jgi:SAM-dependent methyltransferase